MRHTPGPWAITGVSMDTGNVSVGQKDQRIVIADVTNAASFGDMIAGAMRRGGGGFEQGDCDTQHANAQLIASAPDLLAALKLMQAEADAADVLGYGWDKAREMTRNAILKAEGGAA